MRHPPCNRVALTAWSKARAIFPTNSSDLRIEETGVAAKGAGFGVVQPGNILNGSIAR